MKVVCYFASRIFPSQSNIWHGGLEPEPTALSVSSVKLKLPHIEKAGKLK